MIGKLRLLGGRPEPPERPEHLAPPTEAACSRPGCTATTSWKCEYRDGQGNQCGYWCRAHVKAVDGHIWCERHSNVMREVSARRDTIYEIKTVVPIEDRSPSLCSMIVEEIDGPVRGALEALYAGSAVRVITDETVREVRVPREMVQRGPDGLAVERAGHDRAWERGWGVVSHQGYLSRVIVRVSTTEPPSVRIIVNGHTLLDGVPDWIAARAAGEPATDAERQAYRDRVIEAVLHELHNPS
jgi:hypothetical protein